MEELLCRQQPSDKECLFIHQISEFHNMSSHGIIHLLYLFYSSTRAGYKIGGKTFVDL